MNRIPAHFSRRRVLAVGSLSIGGVVLAACGTSSGTTGGDAKLTAQKAPVTIEVLTRNGVTAPTGHSQFYDKQAKTLFTPETKITVNFVDAQPDVGQKLAILVAGGTPPDGSWFGVLADGVAGREQATKGVFKPLDDIIKKDGKLDRNIYFKAMLDAFTVGGKLYALPVHAHYGTTVLYYNKNLARSAGITVPADGNWTHEEFMTAAQKMTKKGDDIWGWWPSWSFSEFGAFWVRQFGGEFLDEAGKKVLLDSSEARAAMDFVYGAQTKAQVINDLFRVVEGAPLNLTGSRGLFAQGKLGMHATTPGLVAEYTKPGQEELKFEFGIALMPKGPNGRRGTQVSGSGMGITKLDKQDAVWEWVKFATNKLNGVEQVFGGAGSPGGRSDVWTEPKLLARDPVYSTILKAYPQGAGSLRLPTNYRYTDLLTAINAEMTKYFKGQTGLAEATSASVQAGNVIMSQ